MARTVRLGVIVRHSNDHVDVTALAEALKISRTKCSKMVTRWVSADYTARRHNGTSNDLYGTAKFHTLSKIYLDEMVRLFQDAARVGKVLP